MAHLGPTLRRRRRREHPAWRALLAVAISVALNWLVITRLDASWLGLGKLAERREVTMAPLAAADWEANRAVRTPGATAPAPPPRPLAPRPPPDQHPGQVVDLGAQPASEKAPEKETRFVSERNTVVAKETRARFAGLPGQKVPSPSPVTVAAQQGAAQRAAAGAPEPREQQVARAATPDRSEAPPPGPGDLAAARPEKEAPRTGGAGGETALGDPRLVIPAHTFARLAGGGSPDHLQGVEEGDGTFLNSREWKYAGYFNRIKEAVARDWYEKVDRATARWDPSGTAFLFKERYTLIEYVLDDKGTLKDVSVARSSNVDFLDRAALEAIRSAQPFPNPPSGLVGANGEVRWVFGFTVSPGQASAVRVYRSPMQ